LALLQTVLWDHSTFGGGGGRVAIQRRSDAMDLVTSGSWSNSKGGWLAGKASRQDKSNGRVWGQGG
jgi:hypothetical protein